jgi:hypothetical protein
VSGLRVRRAPVADWYVEGEESAVMVGATVVVLSALATAVLEILDAERTADEGWVAATVVTAGLVERFGEPEGLDVHATTADVLADLAEQRLVETEQSSGPAAG